MPYDVQIFLDHVVVLGVRINRPTRISRSQWANDWHRLATAPR